MKLREYKAIVQKGKRSKEFSPQRFGYLIHRDISLYLSFILVRFFPFVTPNMVSVTMIVLGLLGCVAFFLGEDVVTKVSGIVLVYVSFLLDKVDGEMARYKKMETLQGVYLDELYHVLVPTAFVISFFIGLIPMNVTNMLLLNLLVFLTIFRRYERKWYMIISIKKEKAIDEGIIHLTPKDNLISSFFNFFPFRATAIVERFDVFIFLTVSVVLAGWWQGESYVAAFFYVYTALAALYAVRWVFLSYFGELEKRIVHIREHGF